MNENTDNFAKGMAHWDESFDSSMNNWDMLQFNQFRDYLYGNILEVGAGFGRISRLVTKHINYNSLTLTEPSPLFFNRLKNNFKNDQTVYVADQVIEKLAVTNNEHFDVVYSVHVLEHIENDKEFLVTSLKLVKNGGYLITAVPALNFLFSTLDKEIGHYRRYDKRMFKQLIEGLDVEIVNIHYNDFLGVIGSFFVSKIGKKNYQGSEESKKSFVQLVAFYSKYVVPFSLFIEKIIKPPIGLNLTVVLRKKSS